MKNKNHNQLEIIFIGTGTAFTCTLGNNNILIRKGDKHILVDFGITAPYNFEKMTGMDILDIETILPTHSHSDHIGGLEFLTLKNRYMKQPIGQSTLNLIVPDEYESVLWNESLKGGLKYNELGFQDGAMGIKDYFKVINPEKCDEGRTIYKINYNGIKLEFFQTNHIPSEANNIEQAFITYGLFIDDKVFFSGDTKFDKDLIMHYNERGAEYYFHDCSFGFNPVHANVDELLTLEDELKAKMYLMHYGDDFEKHQDKISKFKALAEAGKVYKF